MTRRLSVLVAALAVAAWAWMPSSPAQQRKNAGAAASETAPAPRAKPGEPTRYFPTAAGARWVYDHGDGERTEVVTAAEHDAKERVWAVTVGRVGKAGKVSRQEVWEVSERGLFLAASPAGRKEPACFLKLPHKPGEEWEFAPGSEIRCVAVKPRRVKVPAGQFDAVGVEMYLGTDLFVTRWYAPGVGLVKVEDTKSVRCVLKTYTPGTR